MAMRTQLHSRVITDQVLPYNPDPIIHHRRQAHYSRIKYISELVKEVNVRHFLYLKNADGRQHSEGETNHTLQGLPKANWLREARKLACGEKQLRHVFSTEACDIIYGLIKLGRSRKNLFFGL